ncbi:MAG TPA: hypothetical protein VHH52_04265 [Pseudonocardiaceae bacterium]|nr:hypothetical protein [Pseudonocardiaceae bacterium]
MITLSASAHHRLVTTADSGRTDQAEQPGLAQGPHAVAWIRPGAVDLGGCGSTERSMTADSIDW